MSWSFKSVFTFWSLGVVIKAECETSANMQCYMMAKKKVFLNFDFENDKKLKNSSIAQAKLPDSPFSVNDFSLREAYPDDKWVSKVQSSIARCEFFIVLLGKNWQRDNR